MQPLPRQIKWHLKQLASQAHENGLSQELAALGAQFDRWRAGEITAGELAWLVHKADTGPLRDLYKRDDRHYQEVWIASALKRGLLQESDVPQEVWPYLQNALAFIEHNTGGDDVDDE
jgi:hypothetical protein